MSEGGTLKERPRDADRLASREPEPVEPTGLGSPAGATVRDQRREAAEKAVFRMTGGARGLAPLGELQQQRTAPIRDAAARILRKADGSPQQRHAIPTGGGTPLTAEQRAKLEPAMGIGLEQVRVHTGGESAAAARSLGARAFTVGNDVHFGAGQFAPGTKEGDKLLSHELTHVAQGAKGLHRKADSDDDVSKPEEACEHEADAKSEEVADKLHGEHDAKKGDREHGKKDVQAAPAAVSRKIFLALDPEAIAKKATRPVDRHFTRKVDQSSVKKDKNSVISSTVDVAADVAAIRAGTAKSGRGADGEVTFEINGRVYGAHDDGGLYPISGVGIFQLDRRSFEALQTMNAVLSQPPPKGGPARLKEIFARMGMEPAAQKAAQAAYDAG